MRSITVALVALAVCCLASVAVADSPAFKVQVYDCKGLKHYDQKVVEAQEVQWYHKWFPDFGPHPWFIKCYIDGTPLLDQDTRVSVKGATAEHPATFSFPAGDALMTYKNVICGLHDTFWRLPAMGEWTKRIDKLKNQHGLTVHMSKEIYQSEDKQHRSHGTCKVNVLIDGVTSEEVANEKRLVATIESSSVNERFDHIQIVQMYVAGESRKIKQGAMMDLGPIEGRYWGKVRVLLTKGANGHKHTAAVDETHELSHEDATKSKVIKFKDFEGPKEEKVNVDEVEDGKKVETVKLENTWVNVKFSVMTPKQRLALEPKEIAMTKK